MRPSVLLLLMLLLVMHIERCVVALQLTSTHIVWDTDTYENTHTHKHTGGDVTPQTHSHTHPRTHQHIHKRLFIYPYIRTHLSENRSNDEIVGRSTQLNTAWPTEFGRCAHFWLLLRLVEDRVVMCG